MPAIDHNYCLILAGGRGSRLWPCSRESQPKQFIDFFGTGRTQLQQTYDRMSKIISPDHIYVSTNTEYTDAVARQLPEVPREHVLPEPIPRGTAPSVAWGNHRIAKTDPDAVTIVVPSDQLVLDEEAFAANVREAMAFAAIHDTFMTMGVRPTRPEPGYGYIQTGGHVGGNIYKIKSFTEKPDREFAQVFMDSGEFLWNTGVFVSNARHIHKALSRFLPQVLGHLDEIRPRATRQEEEDYMAGHFTSYPNVSVEGGVLDKLDNASVMRCDFGWADLGTWHGIYEALPKNNDDNVVVDSDVLMENSHHNVVKLPRGVTGVVSGLDGFIVAGNDNVLLICKKEDSSALVRKYVNEIRLRKGDKYV